MIHRLLLEGALRRSSALLELAQVDSIADAVMKLVESDMLARTLAVSPALCRTGHNADATRNKFLVNSTTPMVPTRLSTMRLTPASSSKLRAKTGIAICSN